MGDYPIKYSMKIIVQWIKGGDKKVYEVLGKLPDGYEVYGDEETKVGRSAVPFDKVIGTIS